MNIISTKVHGYLDYIVGIALILPWVLSYEGTPALVSSLVGLIILVYSFMTNYEAGAIKAISMNTHLVMDCITGALLIASPWLFKFSNTISTPFVMVGVLEILVVLLTRPKPSGRLNEVAAQKERERKGAVTR
ncbi:hypothetical protein HNQ91_003807 [Filimonas zeae]|nr:hypothetical protein [Filimonas zeae]MDR6340742.1 hypothetical protein [Filimonas zeae]